MNSHHNSCYEIDYLTSPVTIMKIHCEFFKLPKRHFQVQVLLLDNSTAKHLKKMNTNFTQSLPENKRGGKEHFPIHFIK